MVPYWVGLANNAGGATYTAVATGGGFGAGAYTVQITGSDPQNQYEQQILQVSAPVTLVANGSLSVVLPNTPANYTWSVYVSPAGGTQPVNLGLSTSGPTTGPYAGQAVQLAAGATVVITNIGLPQVPPAAPATGVNVFPTYVFGEHFFAALELRNIEWIRLMNADKSDPFNQLRIIGWKGWDGAVILNQLFGAIIESSATGTGAWT
jgi:hypothetical protein